MGVYLKDRRQFVKHVGAVGAGLGVHTLGFSSGSFLKENSKDKYAERLVILHTNDVHSHIHPFPADHPRYPNQGGIINRALEIDRIRKENKHVLLLDAGDIFQGTPFFNFYGGELEMKLMTKLKYDAATIGNHDFDGGIEGLLKAKKFGKFPLLSSNYLFENDLEKITSPYKVFKKGKIRVGVFGVGLKLEGLVDPDLYKGTIYTDPVVAANNQAKYLKNYLDCDLVICLSHLGFKYKDDQLSDMKLAKKTENIDLIIGGHTHTFLDKPISEVNKSGHPVMISQAAWAGLRLGYVEVVFSKKSKTLQASSKKI